MEHPACDGPKFAIFRLGVEAQQLILNRVVAVASDNQELQWRGNRGWTVLSLNVPVDVPLDDSIGRERFQKPPVLVFTTSG